ncbi:MAG: MerC domain-containing protein [Bacteroidota bacterium]
MKANYLRADAFGMIASGLCFVHCVATPFIFLAKACSVACCADAPVWWQAIDYIFIVIAFIAIYYSTRNTKVRWVKIAMWLTWALLLIILIHESLRMSFLSHNLLYFAALGLIALHFYNLKFCKCASDECCAQGIS